MPRFRHALTALAAATAIAAAADAASIRFVDRSQAAGLNLVTYSGSVEKPHILESTGNGILTLDYDGDGFQDLYLVGSFRLPRRAGATAERSSLYRNRGDGTFVDVSERAGVGARVYGQGGCVGDVDADGRPDLYVTAFGPNLLYRNNGDGTFVELGGALGVDDESWSIGCTFLDGDGDGDQDLFVGNYIEATWGEVEAARRTRMWRGKVAVMDGPRGLPEAANAYYRNDGRAGFSVATEEAGLAVGGRGYSMGVASFDYDDDGDPDLYVANDSTPNRLYRNSGRGLFEEVGVWTGSAYNADGRMQGSMGVGVGDYDGDGRLDLVVTNFAHDHYALYRNLGGGLFEDDSHGGGVAVPTFAPLGWAAVFFDPDLDGDQDLFLANGHIYPQVDEDPTLGESYRQLNLVLENESGTFRGTGAEAGEALLHSASSRGAVAVDLENDGDLDLVVSNQDELPQVLANESSGTRHWLLVNLERAHRQVLGARVQVETSTGRQMRERASGGGYASENDPRPHFGLGDADHAAVVRVRLPNGRRVVFRELPAAQVISLAPEATQPVLASGSS